jgi:hypothetical protein
VTDQCQFGSAHTNRSHWGRARIGSGAAVIHLGDATAVARLTSRELATVRLDEKRTTPASSTLDPSSSASWRLIISTTNCAAIATTSSRPATADAPTSGVQFTVACYCSPIVLVGGEPRREQTKE